MGMWGSNQSKHCHFTKETPEWQAGLEKKHVLLKAVTEKKDKLSRYPQQRVHTLIHRTCCKPLHQELVPDTQFPEALIPPNPPCRTHFPGILLEPKAFNGKFPPFSGKSFPSSRTSEIFNSKPDRPCYPPDLHLQKRYTRNLRNIRNLAVPLEPSNGPAPMQYDP